MAMPMLEAVRRKRQMIQQHEQDESELHGGDKTAQEENGLAPVSQAHGGSEHDVLRGGTPDGQNSKAPAETRDEDDNQTELGQEGGFDHISKGSPVNSKTLFQNPKVDTHDDADPNMGKQMSGEQGESNQTDQMHVNVGDDPRKHSAPQTESNMAKMKAQKGATLATAKEDMHMSNVVPSHGEDGTEYKGKGLKAARSKMDGFLAKLRK
jgi:hypothetical protein